VKKKSKSVRETGDRLNVKFKKKATNCGNGLTAIKKGNENMIEVEERMEFALRIEKSFSESIGMWKLVKKAKSKMNNRLE
jgi:hypothetical protein